MKKSAKISEKIGKKILQNKKFDSKKKIFKIGSHCSQKKFCAPN